MFGDKKVMALIPARGGSKGIKRKNIKNLNGQPLIAYSILAAKGSKYIDAVFISTEDEEIAEIAQCYGAQIPVMRPPELAGDHSAIIEAVCHMLNNSVYTREWDSMVLLQPTQPLRTSEDIDCAIEFFYRHKRMGLASVSPVQDSPILIRYFDNHRLVKLLSQNSTIRRQDMPSYYRVNGAIYINAIEEISLSTSFNDNPLGFKMEVSHSVDIDEESDFAMAEYYLRHKDL